MSKYREIRPDRPPEGIDAEVWRELFDIALGMPATVPAAPISGAGLPVRSYLTLYERGDQSLVDILGRLALHQTRTVAELEKRLRDALANQTITMLVPR